MPRSCHNLECFLFEVLIDFVSIENGIVSHGNGVLFGQEAVSALFIAS